MDTNQTIEMATVLKPQISKLIEVIDRKFVKESHFFDEIISSDTVITLNGQSISIFDDGFWDFINNHLSKNNLPVVVDAKRVMQLEKEYSMNKDGFESEDEFFEALTEYVRLTQDLWEIELNKFKRLELVLIDCIGTNLNEAVSKKQYPLAFKWCQKHLSLSL